MSAYFLEGYFITMGINYHQVKIKNADDFVILDDQGFKYITSDKVMLSLNLAENKQLLFLLDYSLVSFVATLNRINGTVR